MTKKSSKDTFLKENQIQEKTYSKGFIRSNLSVFFASLIIFTILAGWYQWSEFNNHKQEILVMIDEKLEVAALNGVSSIHPDFFNKTAALESIDEDLFYQAILKLSQIAKNNNVTYIYMMQKIDDDIVFILSSMTDEELADPSEMVYYLDPYDDAPQAVYDAFETNESMTEEYTDQWGTFRSIFIPLKSENGDTYVVGADIQLDALNTIIFDSEINRTIKMFVLVNIGFALFFWQLITSNRRLHQKNTKLNTDITDLEVSHNKVTRQLLVDELTNCLNRRAYNQKLEELFINYKETNDTFCYAIIDIDDFKHINDTYGHDRGDIVLQNLVEVVNLNIRETDFIFRVGGEEFVMLFPHTNLKTAEKIANRVRKACESETLFENEKVTISIGLVENQIEDDAYQISKRADVLLYQAKNSGKNRVECIECNLM